MSFEHYFDDPEVHAQAVAWWNAWCDANGLAEWQQVPREAAIFDGLMAVRAQGGREIEVYATSRPGVAAEVLSMNGPMDAAAIADWTDLTGADPAAAQVRGMHDTEALAWAEAHYRSFAAFVQREDGITRLVLMAETSAADQAATVLADFIAGRPIPEDA